MIEEADAEFDLAFWRWCAGGFASVEAIPIRSVLATQYPLTRQTAAERPWVGAARYDSPFHSILLCDPYFERLDGECSRLEA